MADRSTFNGSSAEVPWKNTPTYPEGYGDQYARHIKALYDAACFPLTSVTASGNEVAATLDPVLSAGGLRDGMKFTLSWPMSNTGAVTIRINGGAVRNVLDDAGGALTSGAVSAGQRSMIEFIGSAFRLIGGSGTGSGGSSGADRYYQVFTASGTWSKPAGLDPLTPVLVQVWGAGGGGASGDFSGGGGGGAYRYHYFRLSDLPASVAVSIGAGGSPGNAGGASSFGTLITAPGGDGGTSGASGGAPGKWVNGYAGVSAPGIGGGGDGGRGGVKTNASPATVVQPESVSHGGGGGAGRQSDVSSPGLSIYGGNGGARDISGDAPGGGGGASGGTAGSGARGEVRVWI